MAPPKGPSPAVALPDALKSLADQLANLPLEDREKVIAVARTAANDAKRRFPAVSADHLRAAFGVVSLGGDAVEDCNALYDG